MRIIIPSEFEKHLVKKENNTRRTQHLMLTTSLFDQTNYK